MRMVFPNSASGRLMDELATDVGTLFETFFGDVAKDDSRETNATEKRPMAVAMDIDESDQAYELTLDLPGFASDSIEIDVHEDVVTLSGNRARPDQSDTEPDSEAAEPHSESEVQVKLQSRRRERAFGHFRRQVRLPSPIEADAVAAELADGVLVVTLPKADPEKGKRRIPILKG